MTGSHATPGRRRRLRYRGPAIVAVVLVAGSAIGWSLWPGFSWNSQEAGPMLHTVEYGEFIHEITDRGNVESARNIEIKCEVKSKNLAGTQILEVVPEGTEVTSELVADPDSFLVKLDSSALQIDKINQEIALAKSKADESQAIATYEAAKSALKEYVGKQKLGKEYLPDEPSRQTAQFTAAQPQENAAQAEADENVSEFETGTSAQAKRAIESEITVAEENYSRAKQYLKYSQGLYAKGYVTRLQLQADRFAVEKAQSDLDIARSKLDVFNRFTRAKEKTQLVCDLRTAQAKLDAAVASRALNEQLLDDINKQIKKCTIRPEEGQIGGQVVYFNVPGWRGGKEVTIAPGEMARERQVLLRIPNPNEMQVVARINEAKVTMVRQGMPAKIRLDAFPDVELAGTVVKIDAFPAPSGWMGTVVKEYETTVRIDESPPESKLKPGLTAQVSILVERRDQALQVKVQSLFEHGGRFYCLVPSGRSWKARDVQIGPSNDKFVVIEEGLQEGEQIVLTAAAYRDKVKLPDLPGDNGRGGHIAARRSLAAPLSPQPTAPEERQPSTIDVAAEAKRIFAQFDKDHDGLLTAAEVPERFRSQMAAIDTNHDGAIDLAELAAALARAARGAEGGSSKAKVAP